MLWALEWFVGLVMLALTGGMIYGVITAGWAVYHYIEYLDAKRTDTEHRLNDQREYDKKLLNLQFEQQKKMMAEAGLIDIQPVAEPEKSIGRKIKL